MHFLIPTYGPIGNGHSASQDRPNFVHISSTSRTSGISGRIASSTHMSTRLSGMIKSQSGLSERRTDRHSGRISSFRTLALLPNAILSIGKASIRSKALGCTRLIGRRRSQNSKERRLQSLELVPLESNSCRTWHQLHPNLLSSSVLPTPPYL